MTNTWTNLLGGDWSVAGNWSTGTVPAGGDDVLISGDSAFTVTVSQNETAASVTLSDASAALLIGTSNTSPTLRVSGPIDVLQGALTVAGTLDLAGGTLTVGSGGSGDLIVAGLLENGRVVNAGGTVTVGDTVANSPGTLENVTWLGPLDVATARSSVLEDSSVLGLDGLSPGTITIGLFSTLDVESTSGSASLSNVTVDLTGAYSSLTGGTMTVASGATINLSGGYSSLTGDTMTVAAGATVNAQAFGTISAGTLAVMGLVDAPPAGIGAIHAATTLINTGTIANQFSLDIAAPSFTNAGVMRMEYGTIDVAQMVNSGGITIGAFGSLEFAQASSAAGTLAFTSDNSRITLDEVTGFSATIAGWTTGDVVELKPAATYAIDPASSNGTLIVDQNGVPAATLSLVNSVYPLSLSQSRRPPRLSQRS